MLPQTPIETFKLEVQEAFEQHPNTWHKTEKLFINATRQAFYLQLITDLDQKIVKIDKHEKFRFYIQKCQVINTFYIHNKSRLLNVGLKKRNIIWRSAFAYNRFDIIAPINTMGGYNGYKKTYQRMKKKTYRVSSNNVQWLLKHYQVFM